METGLEIHIDLYSACNLGDEDLVEEIMLKREAVDVNARNDGGWTPLMYACWGGHEKVVTQLLSFGARKNEFSSSNQTPLIVAAKAGCLNIIKLVFQKDLLSYRDSYGKCALFYAVDFGYYDITNFLLVEGADANFSYDDGTTALMVAAANGHRGLVELLLEHGADVHVKNNQGFTAQQIAAACRHLDIAATLDPALHALPNLESLLESLGLHKYWPIFHENQIDFEQFLQLEEADLKALGVKLLGPRRKMFLAITSLRKRNPKL